MTEPYHDPLEEQRRRTWLIAGVLAVVVVLIGVGVVFGVLAARKPAGSGGTFTPAEETSATSTSATGSVLATGSTTATTTGSATTASSTTTTTPSGTIVRASKFAYRLNDYIYVANEDGSNPVQVIANVAGQFALSPDGKTIVLRRQDGGTVLVDVATKAQVPIVYANVDGQLPVWAPDSSWLAYTWQASGYAIRRVNRDGTGDTLLFNGGVSPEISPDGTKVAYLTHLTVSENSTESIHVYDRATGKTSDVRNSKGAQYYAFAPGGSFFFVKGGAAGGWLRMANKAMSTVTTVTALPVDATSTPGPLYPSPDGSSVLFRMVGDGYSRLRVVDVSAKKILSIDNGLDAAPVGWFVASSGFLDVEGDLDVVGKTSIYRRDPDGSHRKLVVNGANVQ